MKCLKVAKSSNVMCSTSNDKNKISKVSKFVCPKTGGYT